MRLLLQNVKGLTFLGHTVYIASSQGPPVALCVCGARQALVGDRYGDALLQDSIPAAEFGVLRDMWRDMRLRGGHLLDELYEYDDNAVPPAYTLKVPRGPPAHGPRLTPALFVLQHCASSRYRPTATGEKMRKIFSIFDAISLAGRPTVSGKSLKLLPPDVTF